MLAALRGRMEKEQNPAGAQVVMTLPECSRRELVLIG
jgi:hypothetical protein